MGFIGIVAQALAAAHDQLQCGLPTLPGLQQADRYLSTQVKRRLGKGKATREERRLGRLVVRASDLDRVYGILGSAALLSALPGRLTARATNILTSSTIDVPRLILYAAAAEVYFRHGPRGGPSGPPALVPVSTLDWRQARLPAVRLGNRKRLFYFASALSRLHSIAHPSGPGSALWYFIQVALSLRLKELPGKRRTLQPVPVRWWRSRTVANTSESEWHLGRWHQHPPLRRGAAVLDGLLTDPATDASRYLLAIAKQHQSGQK